MAQSQWHNGEADGPGRGLEGAGRAHGPAERAWSFRKGAGVLQGRQPLPTLTMLRWHQGNPSSGPCSFHGWASRWVDAFLAQCVASVVDRQALRLLEAHRLLSTQLHQLASCEWKSIRNRYLRAKPHTQTPHTKQDRGMVGGPNVP